MVDVNIGSSRFTKVLAKKQEGECSEYYISRAEGKDDTPAGEFGHVCFQNGPVAEAGINGCHQEDLLAIVIHRLQGFQSGDMRCRENAIALTKIEEAMHWLNHRTLSRQNRGVEGSMQK